MFDTLELQMKTTNLLSRVTHDNYSNTLSVLDSEEEEIISTFEFYRLYACFVHVNL